MDLGIGRRWEKLGLVMRESRCLDTDMNLSKDLMGMQRNSSVRRSSLLAIVSADDDDWNKLRSFIIFVRLGCVLFRAILLAIMGSSSMHGQFTLGGGLSSTIFSDPMNLEAVLSFSPSPAVNLQAVVTPFAIPLVTFSSSWQGTCPKVDSVISLGSPSVSMNSVGESMLHRVSVDHSLILHTDQSSEGVPSYVDLLKTPIVRDDNLEKFLVPKKKGSRSTSRLEYRLVSKIQSLVPVSNAFTTIHQDIAVHDSIVVHSSVASVPVVGLSSTSSSIIPPVQVTYDSSISIETSSSR
ncbi:hypothetical protein LWI29_030508 [Acer saccharum]|uniref:Uncharacterized protein n=1 Tax=Acer saccharum TaxID=4024 RepID=A0AA39VZA4_ACESA|nr:hypothetical protein LWI29_030508 [Acer saccharum]